MTNQEIFDRVATHLLTQGKRAVSPETGTCAYRAHDGDRPLMCAGGSLIPDELYEAVFEGETLEVDPEGELRDPDHIALHHRLWSAMGVPLEGRSLVAELQNIHDNEPVYRWREWLRYTARQFGLSDAALDSDNLRAFVSRRASRVGAGE